MAEGTAPTEEEAPEDGAPEVAKEDRLIIPDTEDCDITLEAGLETIEAAEDTAPTEEEGPTEEAPGDGAPEAAEEDRLIPPGIEDCDITLEASPETLVAAEVTGPTRDDTAEEEAPKAAEDDRLTPPDTEGSDFTLET